MLNIQSFWLFESDYCSPSHNIFVSTPLIWVLIKRPLVSIQLFCVYKTKIFFFVNIRLFYLTMFDVCDINSISEFTLCGFITSIFISIFSIHLSFSYSNYQNMNRKPLMHITYVHAGFFPLKTSPEMKYFYNIMNLFLFYLKVADKCYFCE